MIVSASTKVVNLIGKQGSLMKSIHDSFCASVRVLSVGMLLVLFSTYTSVMVIVLIDFVDSLTLINYTWSLLINYGNMLVDDLKNAIVV